VLAARGALAVHAAAVATGHSLGHLYIHKREIKTCRTGQSSGEQGMDAQVPRVTLLPYILPQAGGTSGARREGKPDRLSEARILPRGSGGGGRRGTLHIPFHSWSYQQ